MVVCTPAIDVRASDVPLKVETVLLTVVLIVVGKLVDVSLSLVAGSLGPLLVAIVVVVLLVLNSVVLRQLPQAYGHFRITSTNSSSVYPSPRESVEQSIPCQSTHL